MSTYDRKEIELKIPVEWRVLLYMHSNSRGVVMDGNEYTVNETGEALADAITGLYIHQDLDRFATEVWNAGAKYGPKKVALTTED